ncbi:MAG: hypothetical protein Q9159_006904 [Coniocarpon cinnabarinum]
MNPLITSDLDLPGPEPESEFDEKHTDEVANITPEDSLDGHQDSTMDTQDLAPRADDYEAMKKEYFKVPDDLETLAESTYTWHIREWNTLPRKLHSDTFECGGAPWKVLFFPFGNAQNEACSFYLEQGFEKPPEDWYACVQFMLVLWNPNEPNIQMRHNATHRYNAEESDWGFTKFCELRKLVRWNAEGRGLLEEDAANLTAFVRVIKDPTGVLWHSFNNYDSKKETGMVGLKNQGATCYLNSLLQSLYFTNTFRKAIYQIPTENETDARDNSAYALQRLYYQLQSSDNAVSTAELTASFGWESRQIFEQQDVQELSRILMDKMEERMKGTTAEKTLSDLFVGRMKTYISCINVDFESSRPEDFWDVQLNVRGNATLDDSFRDYIQVETMDGDNKYFAEGYGLQDAKKGVIFESFPQVLHLQLKRFEYNFQADAMTKVYDRYEFPNVWDASPYLADSADKSEPWIYHLHGVLVHSGDLNAGHYYAFLKPEKNGDFYKFDDDRVTKATVKEALDENYGGDFTNQINGLGVAQRNPYTRTWSKQRFMSAYMLVYIRESRLDNVLQSAETSDIPKHLEVKLNEERAELERRRKEREEAHLYMQVLIASDVNFNEHQGFDIFPGTNTHNYQLLAPDAPSLPRVKKVLKSTPLATFTEIVAEEMGMDTDLIRPWGLVGRQNGTIRPDTPLIWDNVTIEEAAQKIQARMPPLRIWVETAQRREDGTPDFYDFETLTNSKNPETPTLLFLKHFDAKAQTLKGAGHVYIGKHKKISELGPLIQEKMGWPQNTNLRLFEEIKIKMIDPMNTKKTFGESELQHGDIVCFQEILSEEENKTLQDQGKYTDPPKFYDYLWHRTDVWFADRTEQDNDDKIFKLELSKIMSYEQVTQKVGQHLGVPPTHLRFSTVHSSTNKPRQFVRGLPTQTLSSIFSPTYSAYGAVMNTRSDCLMYEILEMPLSELETKKLVKISLLTEGIAKEQIVEVLVSKSGCVADLINPLAKKAGLSDDFVEHIRLYEAHSGKIYKELQLDGGVQSFNEWVTIYAERIPDEERNASLEKGDRAVYCFHFDREVSKTHSIPFKFIVKPDEPFSKTKARLAERTGFKDEQMKKMKFAVVSRGTLPRPDYIQDDEEVLTEKLISSEDMLALDHVNRARPVNGRGDVMMIR